jgi:hypothetical protein
VLNAAIRANRAAKSRGTADFGDLGRLRRADVRYLSLIGISVNWLGIPNGYRMMGQPQPYQEGAYTADGGFSGASLHGLNEVAVVTVGRSGTSVNNANWGFLRDLSNLARSPVFADVDSNVYLIAPGGVRDLGPLPIRPEN